MIVAKMNMIQAINSAMDVMMERDPSVFCMGEDIGEFGRPPVPECN